jgi:FkbM family methyltransferase
MASRQFLLRNPRRLLTRPYLTRAVHAITAGLVSRVFAATGTPATFLFAPEPAIEVDGIRLHYVWREGGNVLGMDVGGPWEPNDVRLVMSMLKKGGVFYDVGANIGWYALNVAVRCPQARIVCVEPFSDLLVKNMALNGVRHAAIVTCALGDQIGTLAMTDTYKGFNHVIDDSRGGASVILKTLDALVEEERLPDPSVMKLDIEGYEYFALRGAKRTIRRARPVILCEINGLHRRYGITLEVLLDLFASLDYRLCRVDESLNVLPVPPGPHGGLHDIATVCENFVFCPA